MAGSPSRNVWKAIDPYYIWSAVVGLVVAAVLIAIASMMQTGRLH